MWVHTAEVVPICEGKVDVLSKIELDELFKGELK